MSIPIRLFGTRRGKKRGGPTGAAGRHTALELPESTCELHLDDCTTVQLRQTDIKSCFGTQYLYFDNSKRVQWSRMHRVDFCLYGDQVVSFPVRHMTFTKSHTRTEGQRFEQYRFDQDRCHFMVRRAAGSPDRIVFVHTPH